MGDIFLIIGTMTPRPKAPYSTYGMPARSSTAGLMIFTSLSGASYAINTAVISPTGTPIRIAPNVDSTDATIM